MRNMDTRICKICGIEKEAIKGIWVTNKGKPQGRRCLACSAKRMLDYHHSQMANNHEVYRLKQRIYQREYQKNYYHTNKENTKFIEAKRKRNSSHQKLNLDQARAIKAKRRAAKLKRTPKWLTVEDFKQIAKVYSLAKELSEATGIAHHVDHEIPLQGKLVSGLHVPTNLVISTAAANLSKGNKYEICTT
jgi:ABC-type ATPase with predicted acetyltransferase domain